MSKGKSFNLRRINWLRPKVFGREVPIYLAPLVLIGLGLLLHLVLRADIQVMTQGFLDPFKVYGETRYRAVDYTLDGEVEATGLSIELDESDSAATITIDRIWVKTPGPGWLLRTQLPSFKFRGFGKRPKLSTAAGADLPSTDSLTIRFEGIDWGAYGSEYIIPELADIGPYSGAWFEAAGCERDWWWHGDEFADKFKLETPTGDLQFDFKVLSENELQSRITIGGTSSTTVLERRFRLPEASDFLNSDPESWRTVEIRWLTKDAGFVKARNRYCAEQARITEAEFLERHVQSVERLLLTKGLKASPEMLDAYRRYAGNGAELEWKTDFGKGIAYEDISHRTDNAIFSVMNASLKVMGGADVRYAPEFVTPKLLPDDDNYDSVYAVVLKELGLAPLAALSPMERVAKRPKSFELKSPEEIEKKAEEAKAAAAAEIIKALPPDLSVQISALDNYLGRYVRVYLRNGRDHRGVIEANAEGVLTIGIAAGAGSASIPIKHEQIIKIVRLD